MKYSILKSYIFPVLMLAKVMSFQAQSKAVANEEAYYKKITLAVPEGILLEVGGITTMPDGRIAVCTRRGDVYLIENPTAENGEMPKFRKFASGLHEALGLAYKDHSLYTAQRGELTRLEDTDGDDIADIYETVYAWPLSGHYHEYSFGPKIDPDGNFFISTNVAFGDEEWWRGESRVPWRGWTLKITPEGTMEPWATGMRSPAGLGMINGQLFYDDNQGDWVGSGAIWLLEKGDFTGHPAGLRWTGLEGSPLNLSQKKFYETFDERRDKKNGRAIKPENIEEEKEPLMLFKAKETFPDLKLPAVWLPHAVQGISNSEILADDTGGKFGPFEGQLFVGDQGQSKIMRVVLEEVKGEYQGVSFDFRQGFQSGVLRMAFGHDGSLYVGETNRGWGSAGTKGSGLERIVFTGEVPFEMKTISARPDGFEIEFTKAVDRATANLLDSYVARSFIYKYHSVYGSPTVKAEPLKIKGVKVSDDGLKVRLVIDNLRQYYIHEINVPGIRSEKGDLSVLHPQGFYTLNNIPEGNKLSMNELSTAVKKATVKKGISPVRNEKVIPGKIVKVPDYKEVVALLEDNTCIACHHSDKKLVGPSFSEIAKRRYSNDRIVELIYNPKPENWPEYATPMAPMPQVSRSDALKIAAWINSLRKED